MLSQTEIRSRSKEAPTEDATCTMPDGSPLNITALLKNVELALKLLGICNVQLVLKRRKDLSYLLAASAKELASPHRPITDHLFGENMAEDHEEVQKAFRLTQKLTRKIVKPKPKKPSRFKPISTPRVPHLMGMPMNHQHHVSSPFQQYQPGFQPPFQPQPRMDRRPPGPNPRGQPKIKKRKHTDRK